MFPVLVTAGPYSRRVDAGLKLACHRDVPTTPRGPQMRAVAGGSPRRQSLKNGPKVPPWENCVTVCSAVLAVEGWLVWVQSPAMVAVSESEAFHTTLARTVC